MVAWFLATGCQWDVAQLFAWANMFAGYSQQMTLSAAAQKTLSGELCSLCRVVQKARHADEQGGTQVPAAKIASKPLPQLAVSVARLVWPPAVTRQVVAASNRVMLGKDRASPPLPPPRRSA